MREISAGIIIYRKTEEGIKYLILYHRGRYWNFPKGKIENEEKSFQAALREVKEETGLDRKDLKFSDYFKAYENFTFLRREGNSNKREKVFKTIIFYLAETDKKQIRLTGPHEEGYCWFTYREAMKILSAYKDSQKVLRMANNFLLGITQKRNIPNNKTPQHNNLQRPQTRQANQSHTNLANRPQQPQTRQYKRPQSPNQRPYQPRPRTNNANNSNYYSRRPSPPKT